MRAKITDRSVNQKPPASGQTEIWDTACPGLFLRISYGGRRTYGVMTRVHGKQVRRTIGTTDSHKLSEARDAARMVIRDAAKGIDGASREAKREASRLAKIQGERGKANSFRAVVEAYLADKGKHGGANMKSHDLVKQRLENHAMPTFGDRPIAEITKAEVRDLLRGMIASDKPVASNRLLGNLKLVFKWAVENDKIESSPIADLDKPHEEKSRDRALSGPELAEVWKACETLPKAHAAVVRTMILTGARRTEAGSMMKSELQGDEWHLPGERSKNGRPHIWPLPEFALEVIESAPKSEDCACVFSTDEEHPVSGWSKIKSTLDAAIAEARKKAKMKESMPHWTLHDLRRTMVTRMNEDLEIPPHVIEAIINHVSGQSRVGVAGIYNRATLLPQRRQALKAWAEHCRALATGGRAVGNVVGFKALG